MAQIRQHWRKPFLLKGLLHEAKDSSKRRSPW